MSYFRQSYIEGHCDFERGNPLFTLVDSVEVWCNILRKSFKNRNWGSTARSRSKIYLLENGEQRKSAGYREFYYTAATIRLDLLLFIILFISVWKGIVYIFLRAGLFRFDPCVSVCFWCISSICGQTTPYVGNVLMLEEKFSQLQIKETNNPIDIEKQRI